MKNMKLTAVAVLALAVPANAFAQDTSNWTGFYAGATASNVDATSTSTGVGDFFDLPNPGYSKDSEYDFAPQGTVTGLRAGYDFNLGSGWVAGLEGSMTFGGISETIDDPVSNDDDDVITSTIDKSSEVTARIGYASGQTLIYGLAGVANAQTTVVMDAAVLDDETLQLNGYVMGAGIEQMLTTNLSLSLEYRHADYGTNTYFAVQNGGNYALDADITSNTIRIGLNYRF